MDANSARPVTIEARPSTDLMDLKQDPLLLYKVRVLVYDLCHISRDPAAEARTLATTDELYISAPYFTASEAERIKSAVVKFEEPPVPAYNDIEDVSELNLPSTQSATTSTAEEAIKIRLAGFLDKRKASGDSRPCGPHDLGPIYRTVFGVSQAELEDEKFLARLRRSGLRNAGDETSRAESTAKGSKERNPHEYRKKNKKKK